MRLENTMAVLDSTRLDSWRMTDEQVGLPLQHLRASDSSRLAACNRVTQEFYAKQMGLPLYHLRASHSNRLDSTHSM